MVYRRDLCQLVRADPRALLGDGARQVGGGHEDADDDGIPLCQDKRSLSEQKAH